MVQYSAALQITVNEIELIDNMNISAFLIGVSTAFFSIFALHILFWHKRRSRFQTVVGVIMAIWALWNVKDIIITFPSMYREGVLNWILIIDGWSAITYTIFVFEVTMPGWTTFKRLLLLAIPFSAFTLAYLIWPIPRVIIAYVAFLWCYAWTIVIIGYVKMRQYLNYVRSNYSNIENIDVSWLRPVFGFVIVSQLAWLFTSLYAHILTDIIYYSSVILLWLIVLHYSWNFHPIVPDADAGLGNDGFDDASAGKAVQQSPLPVGGVEQLMESERLYLNKNLTLNDLAKAMGTNRTYVSNYLGTVLGQTFYDYVNQLRIEKMSIPMMQEHPEFKLEYVASESGFSSISTFRRAFVKLTGQTPSQFGKEQLLPENTEGWEVNA